MRHTRAHTRNRRAHHKAEKPTLSKDKETGTVHMRHRASKTTGKYKGRTVLNVKTKIKKTDSEKGEK